MTAMMTARITTSSSVTTNTVTWSSLLQTLVILLIVNLAINDAYESPANTALQTVKEWNLFSYAFPPHAPLNDAKFYNPLNILATGIAVTHDRIFIATPQLLSGVAATVSVVPKEGFHESPVLQPYPDWSFSANLRKNFNCSDLVLVSVYRLRIDSCNRLWILDAGISRSLEDYEKTCPPKLLIVDLNTNQVVRRVDFPKEVLRGESLLTNLIIDETTSKSPTCDDVFVYISDTVEPAIIVYDSERDITWRLIHPGMYPDPDFAESEILGHRFILMDGIVGLTFDKASGIIYFQPLATDRVFSVTKEALRAGPLPLFQYPPVKLVGKKSSQGLALSVSPIDHSLLFSPLSETAIASWNPQTNKQSVLSSDRERLQFVADMVAPDFEPGVIYAISSKFHRFFLKNLNTHEPNNRILRVKLPSGDASVISTKPGAIPLPRASFDHSTSLVSSTSYINVNKSVRKLHSPKNYFASSAEVIKQHQQQQNSHPYNYEPIGLINYSLKNPFTALNHGESFPPNKENRKLQEQHSYLDTLNGEPAPPRTQHNFHHSFSHISNGYEPSRLRF